jgi:hypothetical protein
MAIYYEMTVGLDDDLTGVMPNGDSFGYRKTWYFQIWNPKRMLEIIESINFYPNEGKKYKFNEFNKSLIKAKSFLKRNISEDKFQSGTSYGGNCYISFTQRNIPEEWDDFT